MVLFNIYIHSLTQLVWSLMLGCHQYAENTKLYLLMGGGQIAQQQHWPRICRMAETEPFDTEFYKDGGFMAGQGGFRPQFPTLDSQWYGPYFVTIYQESGHDSGYLPLNRSPDHEYCQSSILSSSPSQTTGSLCIPP